MREDLKTRLADLVEEECSNAVREFLIDEEFLVATGHNDKVIPAAWCGKCLVRVRWNEDAKMFQISGDQRGTVIGDLLQVMMGPETLGTRIEQVTTAGVSIPPVNDFSVPEDLDSVDPPVDFRFPKGIR